MDNFYVYITVNCKNQIQDIGVTINMTRRLQLLQRIAIDTQKKSCKLVYYEEYVSSEKATIRENQLKKTPQSLLLELIVSNNPAYLNLITKDNNIIN